MAIESALAVSRLISILRTIEGRKRVQKIVYLLKNKGYSDFSQRFVLHYYGPFSRQLAAQLDFLCRAGLIKEEKPGDTYVYVPTPDRGAKPPAVGQPSIRRRIPPWAASARSLDEKDTRFLEALSTVVYLHKKGYKGDRLKREFASIKPSLGYLLPNVKRYASEHKWIERPGGNVLTDKHATAS